MGTSKIKESKMYLQDAIKEAYKTGSREVYNDSGARYAFPSGTEQNVMPFTLYDFLRDDWKVKEKKVEISKSEFMELYAEACKENYNPRCLNDFYYYPRAIGALIDKLFNSEKSED